MGPWASVIIGTAALIAVFVAVMGFRGLIDAFDHDSGRCGACGRTTMLPLPLETHQCWQCHYRRRRIVRVAIGHLLIRH